ncbi:uncharacterized protein [Lepisosteus oculatus]|uniref:uncharacterized protein isoform X1 n=1 Tax=Lepisosteus oculatus TaxID=7918 RepID=UPI00371CF64E
MESTLVRNLLFYCISAAALSCCTGSGLCVPEHTENISCRTMDPPGVFCQSFKECGAQPGQCKQLDTPDKLACTVRFRKEASKRIYCTEEIAEVRCWAKKPFALYCDQNNWLDLSEDTEYCHLTYQRPTGDLPSTGFKTTTVTPITEVLNTTSTENQIPPKDSSISDSSTEDKNPAADSNGRVKSLVGVFVTLALLAITAIAVTLMLKYRRQAGMWKKHLKLLDKSMESGINFSNSDNLLSSLE